MNPHDNLLTDMLSIAVPMWIIDMRNWTWEERTESIDALGEVISLNSDVLFNGCGKKGEVANVFNAIAKCIAILAYCPGGVTCFGHTFDASALFASFIGQLAPIPENIVEIHKHFANQRITTIRNLPWIST